MEPLESKKLHWLEQALEKSGIQKQSVFLTTVAAVEGYCVTTHTKEVLKANIVSFAIVVPWISKWGSTPMAPPQPNMEFHLLVLSSFNSPTSSPKADYILD